MPANASINTPQKSRLYAGEVRHTRLRPKRHKLKYRVLYFLLDLDELPALSDRLRWFSVGKRNVFSFQQGDHGDGGDLKSWVLGQLVRAGIAHSVSRIELLCLPKLWGYAFNPLSVYYCRDEENRLVAVLYQVNNTFGGRHTYVVDLIDNNPAQHVADKQLRVSPFNDTDGGYSFRINDPSESLFVGIHYANEEGGLLNAILEGESRPLTNGALFRTALMSPFLTLKVIAGIHWEALKIWLKGVPYVSQKTA